MYSRISPDAQPTPLSTGASGRKMEQTAEEYQREGARSPGAERGSTLRCALRVHGLIPLRAGGITHESSIQSRVGLTQTSVL